MVCSVTWLKTALATPVKTVLLTGLQLPPLVLWATAVAVISDGELAGTGSEDARADAAYGIAGAGAGRPGGAARPRRQTSVTLKLFGTMSVSGLLSTTCNAPAVSDSVMVNSWVSPTRSGSTASVLVRQ